MQALNGFASTQVTTPQPQQPTANPYQGAGLSSATTATAQPASAVNLLTLQQLLAANGTANLALANGAQGKQKSCIFRGLPMNYTSYAGKPRKPAQTCANPRKPTNLRKPTQICANLCKPTQTHANLRKPVQTRANLRKPGRTC